MGPLDLQSDSHLLPDTLPTALCGPVMMSLMTGLMMMSLVTDMIMMSLMVTELMMMMSLMMMTKMMMTMIQMMLCPPSLGEGDILVLVRIPLALMSELVDGI